MFGSNNGTPKEEQAYQTAQNPGGLLINMAVNHQEAVQPIQPIQKENGKQSGEDGEDEDGDGDHFEDEFDELVPESVMINLAKAPSYLPKE